jgi:hypothetical protein
MIVILCCLIISLVDCLMEIIPFGCFLMVRYEHDFLV